MNFDQDTLDMVELGVASVETQGSSGNPQEATGLQPAGLSDAD